jgi:hypothetical protein
VAPEAHEEGKMMDFVLVFTMVSASMLISVLFFVFILALFGHPGRK